ncbi:glycosyltransferase family 4 protein [bacterium]|nr:glycosyltransferase family 4 protein [bacterium]
MQPLTILHVTSHAGVFRGGAVQACRIANAQAERGHRVTVVPNTSAEPSREKLAKALATWSEALDSRVQVIPLPLRALRGRIGLPWIIRRMKPDVVHAHRDPALIAVSKSARRNPRFVFVGQRGTTKVPPARAQAIFASERLDGVSAVADAVRDVLLHKTGIRPPEKIRTIYGSVDLEHFTAGSRDEERRHKLGYGPEHFVIGSLSSWRKQKGFDTLIAAATQAIAKNDRLRLLFLGTGVEEHVASSAHEAGIGNYCRFLGHQTNVVEWLRVMDVSIVCARSKEGLSGVLRESLACQVPVISTDSDGNPEIVRDKETGLLVPTDDVDALAEALLWAAAHPAEMHQFAEAGRQWVHDHCSSTVQAERLEAFYRELIEKRRR